MSRVPDVSKETTQVEIKQRRPHSDLVWIVVVTLVAVGAVIVILVLLWPYLGVPSSGQGSDWVTSSPEEQGMDAGKLEAVMAYIDEHEMAVDSIVVVRHGHIVFEMYGPGYSPNKRHKIHSVTKSVMSMLVGIAIDQGAIEGLDVPLTELLPNYTTATPEPRKEQITLEHLLTMSDGIDWHEHSLPYEHPNNRVSQMSSSADAVQYILDRPMEREPGEAWAYNSGASILLGAAVEQATGRDLLLFARETLFNPIGIGPVHWERTAGGHYQTGGGLSMTPRDMGRLGYLMLHNGMWDGQQILSADWVARSTAAHYPADGPIGYGYQWWILPEGRGYRADGLYEQRIYVLPKADIRGASFYRVDGLVNAFILPACTDLPAPASRATYDAHGVTFEYPAIFLLEEKPIHDQEALSDASGMVQITSTWEPLEIVSVLWSETEGDEDAWSFLEAYLVAIQDEGTKVTAGESGQGQKEGHTMALRFSELTLGEGPLPVVSGVWICDASGRAFAATYLTTDETTSEGLQTALERYLEGLTCH